MADLPRDYEIEEAWLRAKMRMMQAGMSAEQVELEKCTWMAEATSYDEGK